MKITKKARRTRAIMAIVPILLVVTVILGSFMTFADGDASAGSSGEAGAAGATWDGIFDNGVTDWDEINARRAEMLGSDDAQTQADGGLALGTSSMYTIGYSSVPIGYSVSVTYEGYDAPAPTGDDDDDDDESDGAKAAAKKASKNGGDIVEVANGDQVPDGTEITIKVTRDEEAFLEYLEEVLGKDGLDELFGTGDVEDLVDALSDADSGDDEDAPNLDALVEALEEYAEEYDELMSDLETALNANEEVQNVDEVLDDMSNGLVIVRVPDPNSDNDSVSKADMREMILAMLLPQYFDVYANDEQLFGDPLAFETTYTVVDDTEITVEPLFAFSPIAPMSISGSTITVGSNWNQPVAISWTQTTFNRTDPDYTGVCSLNCGQTYTGKGVGTWHPAVGSTPGYWTYTNPGNSSGHREYVCDVRLWNNTYGASNGSLTFQFTTHTGNPMASYLSQVTALGSRRPGTLIINGTNATGGQPATPIVMQDAIDSVFPPTNVVPAGSRSITFSNVDTTISSPTTIPYNMTCNLNGMGTTRFQTGGTSQLTVQGTAAFNQATTLRGNALRIDGGNVTGGAAILNNVGNLTLTAAEHVTGTGSRLNMAVGNTGTISMAGANSTINQNVLPRTLPSTGNNNTITITGGTVAANITVRTSGASSTNKIGGTANVNINGTVQVTNGSDISVEGTGGTVTVGNAGIIETTSTGDIKVSPTGATVDINNYIRIRGGGGGQIDVGGTSAVNVNNTGYIETDGEGDINLGSGTTGQITVVAGGTVQNTSAGDGDIQIGTGNPVNVYGTVQLLDTGSEGNIKVGSAETINIDASGTNNGLVQTNGEGYIHVGNSGTGQINISNGGRVLSNSADADYITVGGTNPISVNSGGIVRMVNTGSDSPINIGGTNTVVVTGANSVIEHLGEGDVNVGNGNGGQVTVTLNGVVRSNHATDGGTVTIGGTNPVTVSAGGKVRIDGAGTSKPINIGGEEEVLITGPNTLVQHNGTGDINIGYEDEDATVTVTNTAIVENTRNDAGDIYVGNALGSNPIIVSGGGVIRIDNTSATGEINVGGTRAITVRNANSLIQHKGQTGDINVGFVNYNALVTVTNNAVIENTHASAGDINVGVSKATGSNRVTVSDGGKIRIVNPNATSELNVGGTRAITVQDAGSVIQHNGQNGDLNVGWVNSNALVTVTANGVIENTHASAGDLNVGISKTSGSNEVMVSNGGIIRVGSLSNTTSTLNVGGTRKITVTGQHSGGQNSLIQQNSVRDLNVGNGPTKTATVTVEHGGIVENTRLTGDIYIGEGNDVLVQGTNYTTLAGIIRIANSAATAKGDIFIGGAGQVTVKAFGLIENNSTGDIHMSYDSSLTPAALILVEGNSDTARGYIRNTNAKGHIYVGSNAGVPHNNPITIENFGWVTITDPDDPDHIHVGGNAAINVMNRGYIDHSGKGDILIDNNSGNGKITIHDRGYVQSLSTASTTRQPGEYNGVYKDVIAGTGIGDIIIGLPNPATSNREVEISGMVWNEDGEIVVHGSQNLVVTETGVIYNRDPATSPGTKITFSGNDNNNTIVQQDGLVIAQNGDILVNGTDNTSTLIQGIMVALADNINFNWGTVQNKGGAIPANGEPTLDDPDLFQGRLEAWTGRVTVAQTAGQIYRINAQDVTIDTTPGTRRLGNTISLFNGATSVIENVDYSYLFAAGQQVTVLNSEIVNAFAGPEFAPVGHAINLNDADHPYDPAYRPGTGTNPYGAPTARMNSSTRLIIGATGSPGETASNIHNLYAGGRDYILAVGSPVSNNSIIELQGGTVGNVYLGGDEQNVYVNTIFDMIRGEVHNVFGGGTRGNTNVPNATINLGKSGTATDTVITGGVFGGYDTRSILHPTSGNYSVAWGRNRDNFPVPYDTATLPSTGSSVSNVVINYDANMIPVNNTVTPNNLYYGAGNVYGGGRVGQVGTITMNFDGGNVGLTGVNNTGYIYGGAILNHSDGASGTSTADVGTVTIRFRGTASTGTTVARDVYGGSNSNAIVGTSTIHFDNSNTKINGDRGIIGGGDGVGITNSTTININSDIERGSSNQFGSLTSHIFGGGSVGPYSDQGIAASVNNGPVDRSYININAKVGTAGSRWEDPTAASYTDINVYGGSKDTGIVNWNVITIGSINTSLTPPLPSTPGVVVGDVFGGGQGDRRGMGQVVRTDIHVGGSAHGEVNGNVFGGGSVTGYSIGGTAGQVGLANIKVGYASDGIVQRNVYGGAQGSGTVNNVTIDIGYGNATGDVYMDVYGGAGVGVNNSTGGGYPANPANNPANSTTIGQVAQNAIINIGRTPGGNGIGNVGGTVFGGGENVGAAAPATNVTNAEINFIRGTVGEDIGSTAGTTPHFGNAKNGADQRWGILGGGRGGLVTNATVNYRAVDNSTNDTIKGDIHGGGTGGSVTNAFVYIDTEMNNNTLEMATNLVGSGIVYNNQHYGGGHIYGGGHRGDNSFSTKGIVNTVLVQVRGTGKVPNNHVYGGSSPEGGTVHNATVLIDGDVGTNPTTPRYGENVYGGGAGPDDVIGTVSGTEYGAMVTINASVGGSVHGGGEDSKVFESTYVHQISGTVDGSVYGGGTWHGWYTTEPVSPASRTADYSATVGKNTRVHIQSGTVKTDVYGGGLGGSASTASGNNDFHFNDVNTQGGDYKTYVTIGDTGTAVVEREVYGGGSSASANITNVEIAPGGTVNVNVYGGGRGETDALHPPRLFVGTGNVQGNTAWHAPIEKYTDVEVNGGIVGTQRWNSTSFGGTRTNHLNGSVYGGGYGSTIDNVTAHIALTTNVEVNAGEVHYDVYGGGLSDRATATTYPNDQDTANVVQGTTVLITDDGQVFHDVHGGGRYNNVNTDNTSRTFVHVNTGGRVHHNVYGGGWNGSAQHTYIEITGNRGDATTSSDYNVGNDMYGGGTGDVHTSGVIRDKTLTSIQSGSIVGTVHGGGEFKFVTNDTEVQISGGRVRTDIYGGGRGGDSVTNGRGHVNSMTSAGNHRVVSKVTVGHAGNSPQSGVVHGTVYGGGAEDAWINGSTEVNILNKGYVMTDVYGGGTTSDDKFSLQNITYGGDGGTNHQGFDGAKVTGHTAVTVNGSNIGVQYDSPGSDVDSSLYPMVNGSVYGGGKGRVDLYATADDCEIMGANSANRSTEVKILHGRVSPNSGKGNNLLTRANVYGGGMDSNIAQDTYVLVDRWGIVGIDRTQHSTGSVFGGGIYTVGAAAGTDNMIYVVRGNTEVMINGHIYQSVWGGGHWSDVLKNTQVDITDKGNTYDATSASVDLDVIGGGLNANILGDTGTIVNVNQNARVRRDVYGGGWNTTGVKDAVGNVQHSAHDIKTQVTITGFVGMETHIKYIEPTPPGGDPLMEDGSAITNGYLSGTPIASNNPLDPIYYALFYGHGSDPQVYADRGGNVFGGGYGFGNVNGDTVVLLNNNCLVMRDVFGGGYIGEVKGAVGTKTTLMPKGQVYGTIHGGGFGRWADVDHDTYVYIYGKVGRDEHDPRTNNGSLTPVMEGSTPTWPYGYKIPGNVYGGGSYGDVLGQIGTYVEVMTQPGNDVARVSNNVYGGGFEGQVSHGSATAQVLVKDGAQVWYSVFGGGHQREVRIPTATRDATVANKTDVVVENIKGMNTMIGHPEVVNRRLPDNSINSKYVEEWEYWYQLAPNDTALTEHTDLEHHAGRVFGGGHYATVMKQTNVVVEKLEQIVFRTVSGGNFGRNNDDPENTPRNVTLTDLGQSVPMGRIESAVYKDRYRYNNNGVYDDLNYYMVIKHFQDYTQSNITNSYLTVYYNLRSTDDATELGMKYSPEHYTSIFTTRGGVYHPWRPFPHMDIIVEPEMDVPDGDTFFRIETGYTIDMSKGGFVTWQDGIQIELLIDHIKGIASMNRIYGPYNYNIAHTRTPTLVGSRFAYNYLPRTLFARDLEHKTQFDVIGVRFYIPPATLDFMDGNTTDTDGWSGSDSTTGTAGYGGMPTVYAGGPIDQHDSEAYQPTMAVEGELIQKTRRAVQGAERGQTTYFSELRYDQITGEMLGMINAAAHDEGGPAILMADTMEGKVIQGRMYLDPSKNWPEDKVINLRVYTTPDQIAKTKKTMEKFYKNTFAYVKLAQTQPFGTEVEIAADVDLSKLDKDSLIFYTYNEDANTYKRIANPQYFIDSNGYLHFFTAQGGSIVITDAPLARK